MVIGKKVKKLPETPGVYIMKSKQGRALYVGKASSLRKRVSSYFSRSPNPKTRSLLKSVAGIDYVQCANSQQALILEAALIKEKRPKYNISLRDSKSYPYLEITKDKFPRIFVSRPRVKAGKLLFGPYPQADTLKSALTLIRRIFPYRSCKRMPKNACLFFHLKLCPAPCLGKISAGDYRANIRSIVKILKGQRKQLTGELTAKMKRLAKNKKFEAAAALRDKLAAVENLYAGKPVAHEIVVLKEILNLPRLPLLMEAIDISSLGANDCAGSLVVFRDGTPSKSDYRRFRIKTARQRDDYDMVAEVLKRRYSRLIREKSPLPDLIIIDGGKGHLLRAHKELEALGVSIPLAAIAKRNEEIWTASGESPLPVSRNNPGLHLIQRIRDEAHRFSHAYGMLRRKKRIIRND